MKFARSSALLALGATTSVSAQVCQSETPFLNQSAPFTLQIANAANASLNGLYLFACHSGAAQEGICLGGTTPAAASSTFYFNTTDTDSGSASSGLADQGYLVWNLPVSNLPAPVSQAATLQVYRLGTNVVVPQIGFGCPTPFHFADDGKLTLQDTFIDDSTLQSGVFPPFPPTPVVNTYNNWYICWANVGASYYYQSLAWVTAGVPHNPTCQKVDVVRTPL